MKNELTKQLTLIEKWKQQKDKVNGLMKVEYFIR